MKVARGWPVPGLALALLLAACSLVDPDDNEVRISADVPASAEAVFLLAHEWLHEGGCLIVEAHNHEDPGPQVAAGGPHRTTRLRDDSDRGRSRPL